MERRTRLSSIAVTLLAGFVLCEVLISRTREESASGRPSMRAAVTAAASVNVAPGNPVTAGSVATIDDDERRTGADHGTLAAAAFWVGREGRHPGPHHDPEINRPRLVPV